MAGLVVVFHNFGSEEDSDGITPTEKTKAEQTKAGHQPRPIEKLTIIEKEKVASIVVQDFDWQALNIIRNSLLYKEELIEAIESLNSQMRASYTAARKKYFSVPPEQSVKIDDDLIVFGSRLILKKDSAKGMLNNLPKNNGNRLITFKTLKGPLEKASQASYQLSMSDPDD